MDNTPDTTVNGISRLQTKDATAAVLVDIPLSPGGNARIRLDIVAAQAGAANAYAADVMVDVYSPASGAPTATVTSGTSTATGTGSGWTGIAGGSVVLVAGVYRFQVAVSTGAAVTANWCATWRITQV